MKKWLDKYDAPKAQVGTMLAPISGEDVAKFFDMFSVPQKAATKLVTGKYQTPSEAMNIKNPVGAFATDMILDPVNLMGAGVAARQAIKFKPKPGMMYRGVGENAITDAIESGIIRQNPSGSHAGTPLFVSPNYNVADMYSTAARLADKNVKKALIEIPKDAANFIQDDRFGFHFRTSDAIPTSKAKLYKQDWLRGYKQVKQPKKKAQNGIEGTMGGLTDVGFNYNGAWGGTMQMGGSIPGAVGFTYARTINPAPDNGPGAKKTKASAQDGKKVSYSQWKKQYNLKETPDYNLKRAWELGYTPDKTGHLPTVDNQTGQFLKAKGHPTLQLELDWYNSPEAADFRSKNAIDSSGKFFKYVPKGQNGQEMKYYQEGLDFKPKTISQDGTVIDPMGYWNPENVGNPVIIPSNVITMEGVDQPLIGISDTGDVQYMEPGEDYEFDGEYVTEYPMMQKGGRVPIYVDDPKDPRLLAYQDSLYLTKAPMEAYKRSETIGKLIEQGNFDKANKLLHSGYIFSANARKALDRLTKYNKKEPKPIKGIEMGWGLSPIDDSGPVYKKPVQPVKYRKPEPKKEQPVKEQPKPVEIKQNVYEGSPVYSGTVGSGGPSALVGFANQKGDTTYIKPEDYERFAVPKYGKQFIESKTKKMKNGGVSVNNADAQPIKKLDQLLNFTNYNKPTKGGWLDKYN